MSFIRKIVKIRTRKEEFFYVSLKKLLGFTPKNILFYKKAFIHRSIKEVNKETGLRINYERLEFLGDAMLSAVIASHLFKEVPSGDEGYLTQMRSKIVSREHLNELGKDLDLLKFVKSTVAKSKFGENIHGNVFEALIGINSDFIRTPKKGDNEVIKYSIKINWISIFEVLLGFYCVWSFFQYLKFSKYLVGPFLCMYALGFLFIGFLTIIHSFNFSKRKTH